MAPKFLKSTYHAGHRDRLDLTKNCAIAAIQQFFSPELLKLSIPNLVKILSVTRGNLKKIFRSLTLTDSELLKAQLGISAKSRIVQAPGWPCGTGGKILIFFSKILQNIN